MKKTVLVTLEKDPVFDKFENFEFIFGKEFTDEQLKNASVVLGSIPDDYVAKCENLEWYQLSSAGVPPFVNKFAQENNVKITNAAGAYGLAVSEFMFAATLSLMKNLQYYRDFQNEAAWKSAGKVKSFYGSTVLVLGAGDIGQEYAMRAKAFGSYVIGVKRNVQDKPEMFDEICTLAELKDVIKRADVIFNVLPGTDVTTGIISSEIIDLMKPTALFVNGGRGTTVDQKAMIKALAEDKIGGAALDVFEVEPLEDKTDIWSTKNLLITPHQAGGFSLAETYKRIVAIAVKNFESYQSQQSFDRSVDLSQGY